MNLKHIEVFVKIAETKSFSKTAKELYLTQPTVSTHMASLETSLGTKLIARTTKEVNLTDNGELFYTYAKKMMLLAEEMESLFAEKANTPVKEVSIAASSIPAHYILPRILPKIREKYPDVVFQIRESNSETVAKQISNKEVDIGFTGTKYDFYGCVYNSICDDEVVLIAPNTDKYRDFQLAKDLKWLYNEPVIMRPIGSGTRKEAERLLVRRAISIDKLQVIAEIESTEVIKRSVRNGMGVAVMSMLAVKEEVEEGSLLVIPISKAENNRKLYIVNNKFTDMPEPIQWLMKQLKKYNF
ncbi:MAG: LysR family transcriptional regulator [Dorea sp.]|nr:LysR family transcriptional regulator [Dorea sp.]